MTSVLAGAHDTAKPISIFGPDFPFEFDRWISHPDGLGYIPESALGQEVAIIGAGIAGMVAAFEIMKLGLRPVLYESTRIGGRLRSERFDGAPANVVAELGGMRFPASSFSFFHYVDMLGLTTKPFPNPLTPAAGSTVIDLEGVTHHASELPELPTIFQEVAKAWSEALEEANFTPVQEAIRARDARTLKSLWNDLIVEWDDRTFYDFVASSKAFSKLSFHHREVFGQVGFGTGGWDSDFPNSMLEILRVVMTNCDEDQHLIVGGAEQVPRGLWTYAPQRLRHWPVGTTLAKLHGGVARSRVKSITRGGDGQLCVTDQWGVTRDYRAVLATCQSWLLTTEIDCDESLFSQKVWTALDRTRYMQSSKTFVLVDRPFWKDVNPMTGRDTMSMTLTDRMTRGTYLFDNGDDSPAVVCLTYSWMSDAMKVLPYSAQDRADMAINALKRIYPDVDINRHIVGEPISVSWEADRNFLGAFKGALPGHYRYNHRVYSHFMQEEHAPEHRGIFLAGDDVSWTPAWAEGAVQTALNAVWGIMTHFGGRSSNDNPGPGDMFAEIGPLKLPE
ncbi:MULTISPECIES: flavin monoamine oxidase family protein [unclassified Mycolicibacterium]|uniref:flavin monoamine oxidase family protein n=1 Tax=unclassified Mycolicibacterium TaxID=2636767 RepID=UPI002EDA09D5